MRKWIRAVCNKYTKARLDRKIAVLYMVLMFTLSLTLTILITRAAGRIILRDRKDLICQNVNVAKEAVETELNTILNTGLGIVMNDVVQDYYIRGTVSLEDMEKIRMMIQMTMDGNSKIELITLFDDDRESDFYTKSSRARYKAEEEIQTHYADAMETEYYDTRIYYSNTISASRSNSLTVYFPVYSTERLNLKYGVLAISFGFEMPHVAAQEDELKYQLSLLDSSDRYFAADAERIGTQAEFLERLEGGETTCVQNNVMYVVSPLKKWKLSMAGQVDVGDVNQTYAHLILVAAVIVAVLLAIALFAGQKLLAALYAPMYELLGAMDQIDSDNLGYRLPVEPDTGDDQIKLREGFNNMMQRLSEAMETIQNKQAMIEKLRFGALQSQIQPHFLYNTLESIHWQAMASGDRELSDMVKAMAKFYRVVLSSGADVIPLRQELEHVKSYITIQNLRYDNIIQYEIEIPEELMDYRLPKITLQPLVENAIYHGIRVKEGAHGKIKIYSNSGEDKLEIIVANDGAKITKEEMIRINNLLAAQDISEGYGINNVNKRLQMEFGMEYGLGYRLSDPDEECVMAIITLPGRRNEKADHEESDNRR